MATVEVFARTEVGCARERNEDAFLVLDLAAGERGLRPDHRVHELGPPGTLVAVCDGMGGAAAGDVASRIAVDGLEQVSRSHGPLTDPRQIEHVLLEAVRHINHSIAAYAAKNPARQGMGTTLTAAVLAGPQLVLVQIGDSRAYVRRGRRIQQITTDQSVVGQMIANGQLTPEQARSYHQRNVLLQALGVQDVVSPEVCVVDIRAGDVLLLCTDGLTGPLEDAVLLDLLVRHEDPMRCCRALTEAACAQGGPDNITVAIARFTGEGLPLPHGREPIVVRRKTVAV